MQLSKSKLFIGALFIVSVPFLYLLDYNSVHEERYIPNAREVPPEFLIFEDLWTTEREARALWLITVLDEVAHVFNFTCFMTSTTLLGSANFGRVLPWHDELVFAYQDKVPLHDLEEIFSQKDIILKEERIGARLFYKRFDWPSLKLIPLGLMKDGVYVDGKVYPYEDMFPLTRRPLFGFMTLSPKVPEKVLDRMFSNDWAISCDATDSSGHRVSQHCGLLTQHFGYTWSFQLSKVGQIPRVIHQISTGPEMPSSDSVNLCKMMNPNWEYKLWTLDNLTSSHILTSEQHLQEVARAGVLNKYGGVWISDDYVCVKPLDEILQHNMDFFTAFDDLNTTDDVVPLKLNVIGSVKKHFVLQSVLSKLTEHPEDSNGIIKRAIYTSIKRFFQWNVGIYPKYELYPATSSITFHHHH